MMPHAFGCIPDTLDERDHPYQLRLTTPRPPFFDLSFIRPAQPRLDQGQLGSCVAHGTAGEVLFHQPDFLLSRLWLYYKARSLEGAVKEDAGCMIRDVVKVLTKNGAPPETDWPYDIAKFAKRPPTKCTADAKRETVISYQRIDNAEAARDCIASGQPYIVGFDLYSGFESEQTAKTGIVPMPKVGETSIGGHCMLGWGYSPTTDTTLNSWGRTGAIMAWRISRKAMSRNTLRTCIARTSKRGEIVSVLRAAAFAAGPSKPAPSCLSRVLQRSTLTPSPRGALP